jgi:hypothetical protein
MSKKHKKKPEPPPHFPFNKMPYQQDTDEQLKDYESDEELDLGESEKRMRRRTLREERNPGHEP